MPDDMHPHHDDEAQPQPSAEVPIEEDAAIETEEVHPRREAHAEFIVQSEAPSATVLREAMDPANQSLAEALRLSYRVLQLGVIVLIVLFLISGFRGIKNNETGVQTLFGKIRLEEGRAELSPGLAASWLPYPAAEFIVFNRTGAVGINDTFWPDAQTRGRGSYEDAAAAPDIGPRNDVRLGLGPGRDGFILLEGGDLGHIQLQATYEITDAADFVQTIRNEDQAHHFVRLALQRATVHVAAKHELDSMINQEEVIADEIKSAAQEFLSGLQCGIELKRVEATNIRPPLAVHAALANLGEARNQADRIVAEARTKANKTLAEVAGEGWPELLDLIEQWEETVLAAGPQGVDAPEAQSLLAQIDEMLQSDQISGRISTRIQAARAYRDEVRSKLGGFADRFTSLYPQYNENPELVIVNELTSARQRILSRRGAEVFYLPDMKVTLEIMSSFEAMLEKRKERQRRQSQEAMREAGIEDTFRIRFGDEDDPHRLRIEDGGVTGRGGRQ